MCKQSRNESSRGRLCKIRNIGAWELTGRDFTKVWGPKQVL